MKKSPAYSGPMRFAHRGLVQYAPENTIDAFKAAIEYGCEGIELDIRLSGDGIPIVVHDGDFRRMTRGVFNGVIAEMNKDDIVAVELPFAGHLLPYDPPVPYSEGEGSSRTYSEEQVEEFRKTETRSTHLVTFEEFDKWFETVDANTVIEIEFCCSGLMESMYEILSKSKNLNRYIIFSGHSDVISEIQSMLKEKGKPEGLRIGANYRKLSPEIIEYIRSNDFYEIGLNDGWFDEKDVELLKDMGICVFSNLGDYPAWWKSINEYGIAGFKTNYAEAYTDWAVCQK